MKEKEHFKIFIYSLFLFLTDKITVTFFYVKGMSNYNNLVVVFFLICKKKIQMNADYDEKLK